MKTLASGLQVAPQVQRVMHSENITEDELDAMVKRAAIVTHERGNRRYHDWVFELKNGSLWRMTGFEIPILQKEGSIALTSFDECPNCEGDGCRTCNYTGEVEIHYVPKTVSRKR